MFLKAVYVDGWKNTVKPTKLKSVEGFVDVVERCQAHVGESRFDWELATDEIIRITLGLIRARHISDGEIADIEARLPQGLKSSLFARSGFWPRLPERVKACGGHRGMRWRAGL